MKKIIFLNTILIVFILVTFDISMFYFDTTRYYKFKKVSDFLSYYIEYNMRPTNYRYLYNKYILGFDKELKYRRIVNYKSNEKPILLFGGSFVYGYKLNENEIASEIFGKYTTKPIYNRSYHGLGPQLMLFHLENEKFYKQILEPQYVIYTFRYNDLEWIIRPSICSIKNYIELFYKYDKKENKLKRKSQDFILKEPFTICNLKNNFNKDIADIELFKLHLLQAKKEADKHWTNSKFILFIYREADYDVLKSIENELKENGFIIVKRKDIAPFKDNDTKFALSKDDDHPNEYAWDYIVPKLLKEIENQISK